MNFLISSFLIMSFLTFSACNQSGNSGNSSKSTQQDIIKENQVNTLSEKEQKEGWILLFDGITTDSWRGFKSEHFPDKGWHVKDRSLMIEYSGTGEQGFAGDIVTKQQFENFDLKLEWKISPGGNSGIFFNVTESDDYTASWHTAHEIQVLDDFGYDDIHDYAPNVRQLSGALYDLYSPSQAAALPAGEWNRVRIRLEEGHLQHWLNEIQVLDVYLWSEDWQERVAKSKFSKYPDFGQATKGSIGLQDHGHQTWYRNIKILEL